MVTSSLASATIPPPPDVDTLLAFEDAGEHELKGVPDRGTSIEW
jgi:hypothetical protein